MESCKVYFVRHGESEWNKLNLFCGWCDVNLSEKGILDAENLTSIALKKENCKFDLAFSSALKRSQQTLTIILNALELSDIPKHSAWELNERHYGALTGFNKRQMADAYGEDKVQEWRRSYDTCPPEITSKNDYYQSIRSNVIYKDIPENEFPNTESLACTLKRVIPFWDKFIVPEIMQNRRILIVAHGTSLRAIIKHIESLTKQEIMKFNVPNSIPFYYEFDTKTAKIIGGIKFLADEGFVKSEMARVASIGKAV